MATVRRGRSGFASSGCGTSTGPAGSRPKAANLSFFSHFFLDARVPCGYL